MKTFLLSSALFINSFLFSQSGNIYQEITSYEMELQIIQNHKEGLSGYSNIYSKIVFEMEDFSLLENNFDFLSDELNRNFSTEQFYIDLNKKRLIVIYEKSKAETDDFLKIFKETMQLRNVYMHLYIENTVVKK
jgi:hypothetical protein